MLSEYLTGEGFDATLVLTGKAGVEVRCRATIPR